MANLIRQVRAHLTGNQLPRRLYLITVINAIRQHLGIRSQFSFSLLYIINAIEEK
ncbi:hypothetical protein [Moorena sp. SIO3A2]|uniref:hypothetical protein n=1 Tax=Moorena sp. SIO3A2 TaxID=2607841 RepID=UPI0013B89AA0|nr:hypothetical protein [Moorena sp. SIO3A2]NER88960.1 hypothetical protein [Moorena sp. SIO3A2]